MSATAAIASLFSRELQRITAEIAQIEEVLSIGLESYARDSRALAVLEESLVAFEDYHRRTLGPLYAQLSTLEATQEKYAPRRTVTEDMTAGPAFDGLPVSNDDTRALPDRRAGANAGRQALRTLYRAMAARHGMENNEALQARIRTAYEQENMAELMQLDFTLFCKARGISLLRRWQGLKKRQLALRRAQKAAQLARERMLASSLYTLKTRAEEAQRSGRDLIEELRADMEEKIARLEAAAAFRS
ncbi:MAG: hypothetical protein IT567_05315 [Alphaproteobacteria bacterium]|nr:hypothetical protein [Alphaproteobacteria bacterium]